MPRGIAKHDLPSKPCARCGRPMLWRKLWERCWEQVKYCSQRCRDGKTAGPTKPR